MLSGFPGRGCGEHRGTRSRSARLLSGNTAEVYFAGDCGSSRRGPRTSPAVPLWDSFCPHQDVRFGTFFFFCGTEKNQPRNFFFSVWHGILPDTHGWTRRGGAGGRRENRGEARGKQRRSDVPTSACSCHVKFGCFDGKAHQKCFLPRRRSKLWTVFLSRLSRSIPYQRDLFSSRRLWSTARQSACGADRIQRLVCCCCLVNAPWRVRNVYLRTL